LPEGESKDAVLTVRLQPSEMEAVAKAAAKAGKSIADYVRDLVLRPPRTSLLLWTNGALTPAEHRQLSMYVSEVLGPRK
jgi:hypothetical protein